jgi:sugar-specific transcriptional regulator TrmB
MGLTKYQALVYCSLVSLGPAAASEVHRHSGVPRTKIYETLEELSQQGIVEVQAGRPTLYRVVEPDTLVRRLTEDYRDAGAEVRASLEEQNRGGNRSTTQDLAWTVKGDSTIRRKLAEVVTSAKSDVLILETYPPAFILSVKDVLKAVSGRGVKVRAVCLIRRGQSTHEYPESEAIEYRSLYPASSGRGATQNADDELIKPLEMAISAPYGLAIIDESESFVIIPSLRFPRRSLASPCSKR